MPVAIKSSRMEYKDDNGNYIGVDAVSERTTAEQVAEIEAVGNATISTVEQAVSESQDAVNTLESQKNAIAQTVASMAQLGTDTSLSTPGMAADAATVGNLKSALDATEKEVFDYITSQVYPGNIDSAFVTSIFSGWITDYIAQRNINAVKFILPIKARATAITSVRVFYGEGSFFDAGTNHIDLSVNIPANTKKDIEFELRLSVKENAHFYVGYACNQLCDMQKVGTSSSVAYGGSCYTVNGTIPDNSKYGASYSTTDKNMLYIVEAEGKITKPITQDRLSFAEFVEPENLLNINDTDECKKGYWYYATSVGSTVYAQETEYTYTALKAKVYDASKITIGTFPQISPYPPAIYWVGVVDKDMKLLTYSVVNTSVPITYNIPEGAVYILASLQSKADSVLDKMMIVKGETISKYVEGVGELWILRQCITESEEKVDVSYLKLPASYDLVVGDTFQLFKKGILDVVNPDLYDIKFTCSKGNAYDRFFEITPSTAETLVLYIDVYREEHQLIDSGSVNLVIRSKKSSPSGNKNILCVGDSLTTSGDWPKEFCRRLTGSGGSPSGDELTNISFIGTRENQGVHYEGYGGWTFSSYNNATTDINAKVITCVHDKTIDDQHSTYKDANNAVWKLETIESGSIKIIAVSGNYGAFPSTGTLTWVSGGVNHSDIVYTASENAPGNPFWDTSANKVDFASYCSRIGASGIDYVFVLLGWNNAGASESNYKQQAQTFIDNVHASYPNAKIVLMGLQIPAKDGLGVNYGATGIYSDFYQLMNYVYNLDSWYADIAEDDATVYSINVSGQFDTEHNMQESTRPVNTRNATTETYQTNGVHPATPGYLQIADAAYRVFMGL